MKIPEYVTPDEVKRVCRELGIRDWTELAEPKVLPEEAGKILSQINTAGMDVDIEAFRKGLEVELEHGTVFTDFNVTNNHPILTGKIVMAHFMETLDYYERLEVAELEGDLLKAVVANKAEKVEALYKKLIQAKLDLSRVESTKLGRKA